MTGLSGAVVLAASMLQVAYPSTYTDLRLPELPGATVVSAGRTNSLKDGLSIRLKSSKTLIEVASFYRDQLKTLGFVDASTGGRSTAVAAGLKYTRGALRYSVILASFGSTVDITITVLTSPPS
jgi:hypothetical protein